MAAKYELGIEEGIERGIEKGIEKDKLENKLETARKMNEDGFSIEQIVRITELSLDDLKKNGLV